MKPIHAEIHVPLAGEDGNAFAILGRVKRIMRRAGLPDSEWDSFYAEAKSGDYDNLLATVCKWFDVFGDDATLPCIECDTPVKADIHAEELGMCVECSNEYFNHDDEEDK